MLCVVRKQPPHICVHKRTCRQMRADVSERGANSASSERGPWSQLGGLWPQHAKFSVGIFRHGRSCQTPGLCSPLRPGQTPSQPMRTCSLCFDALSVRRPLLCLCLCTTPGHGAMATGVYLQRALRRGSAVNRCGPEEVKVSPTSAPLEPWRGFDGDGDKSQFPPPPPRNCLGVRF